jgi:MoaA/NifB/PqqE/SkfB family radical SAM enzyme
MIDYNIQLTLSIDGIKKETYEKIRCGADFSTIIKVLNNLKNYREAQKNNRFKIRMNTILSHDNYLDLFSFLDFAHEYNIDELYFFPLVFDLNNKYDLEKFISLYTQVIEYVEKNKLEVLEKAKNLNINIINTIPSLQLFNETIKKNCASGNFYTYENDNECKRYLENKEMISYNKSIIKNNNSKQIKCSVPWQRLRLDKIIRPHCFCKGNVNIGIVDDKFDIDKLWNCEYIQSYRKMIINEDFKEFCNPSCYLGFVPEKQYNGIV